MTSCKLDFGTIRKEELRRNWGCWKYSGTAQPRRDQTHSVRSCSQAEEKIQGTNFRSLIPTSGIYIQSHDEFSLSAFPTQNSRRFSVRKFERLCRMSQTILRSLKTSSWKPGEIALGYCSWSSLSVLTVAKEWKVQIISKAGLEVTQVWHKKAG